MDLCVRQDGSLVPIGDSIFNAGLLVLYMRRTVLMVGSTTSTFNVCQPVKSDSPYPYSNYTPAPSGSARYQQPSGATRLHKLSWPEALS